MKKKVVQYGAAVLLLGGLAAYVYLGNPPPPLDPDALMTQALQAEELSDRVLGAAQLIAIKDPDPVPYLQQILALSQDPEVLVQAIDGLASRINYQTVPLLIGTLNHSSPKVRQAGYVALLRHYGGELPDKLSYGADAPAADRAKVASRLQKLFQEQKPPKKT